MSLLLVVQICLVFKGVASGLRVGIGVIIYGFLPGYLILSILSREDHTTLRNYELVALSLPGSIAVSTILSLLASKLLNGFSEQTQIVIFSIFIGMLLVVAITRAQTNVESTAIPASILMLLVVLGSSQVYSYDSFEPTQDHTLMYILSSDGSSLEDEMIVNTHDVFKVNVGVEHPVGESVDYIVRSNVFPDRKVEVGGETQSLFSYEVRLPAPGLYLFKWYLMHGERRLRYVNLWVEAVEE